MSSLRGKGGYTLVEVIGYGLILGVLLNFTASILLSSKRIHTLGTLALERNEVIDEVVRDFRKIAAQSVESGSAVPKLSLPPNTPVLTLRATGPEQHYAVWRTDSDKRLYLEKYLAQAGNQPTLYYRKVYSSSLLVADLAAGGSGALAQMQFELDNKYTPRTVPRRNSVAALLGGR